MNNHSTSKDADDPQTQWLTFILGNETYSVDVLHVQEVLRCPEITPVPGAPAHVLGIINLRGEVITRHMLIRLPQESDPRTQPSWTSG